MRMKGVHIGALVGMVLGATLCGWSNADAVLCVKSKKGVVRTVTIRDGACKGKESVGDASVLLGLPTTTTTSTTTTTLPERAARIVDSVGNDVAWVNPNVGLFGERVWALGTIDDQAITFPMRSSGPVVIDGLKALGYVVTPPIARDDSFYGFDHEGTDCEGDLLAPFTSVLLPLSSGYGDLVKIAYPSMDGRSGYVVTSEISVGVWSHEDIQFACATPPDPAPTNVACNDQGFAVAPIGSEYACQVDSATQCTCRRCCTTFPAALLPLWRVQTIDLGLGDSKPPFKVEH